MISIVYLSTLIEFKRCKIKIVVVSITSETRLLSRVKLKARSVGVAKELAPNSAKKEGKVS